MISNLRTIRLQKGLTISEVAVRSKTSQGTVVFVEKYGHTPKAETKVRLAQALDVPVSAIWPDEAK